MPKFGHSHAIRFLIFFAFILAFTSCSQTPQPVAEQSPKPQGFTIEQVAKTYGLDSFGQVEAIRYTWNAQFPGVNLSRSWVWEPKKDQVSYEGKDKDGKPVRVTYLRSQLNSQPDNVKNEVDPAFVNDNYWLLFPFHAYWDKSATATNQGIKQLPQGNGSAELVAVKYPSDGGYTPGDQWDLYVGKDNRVEQFVYHRGGPKKPSTVITTWEGYKKAGPLLISTDHNGTADGNNVRIFITDVAVKVTGSDNWINAQ
ncbi:MAG TPA: hypothetical protein VFS90_10335 [Pyrinomonadaceae bacterium]|nr:hypothetical protein [Pyrinomonadaceae bacterium]